MLFRLKGKLGLGRRDGRLLTPGFQPVEDPLRPIEIDLAAILNDVKAISIDRPPTDAVTDPGAAQTL